MEEITVSDHEFGEFAGGVLVVEDGRYEGGPEAGKEAVEGGQGVAGWLGEGVVDGGCEAGVEEVEICFREGWCVGRRSGECVGGWLEREGRGADEGEELGASVGWEVDVWNTGFVEEVRAGVGDYEDRCKAWYLGFVLK